MKRVLGKYSTLTQSVLHQFQTILSKSWTVEILQIDFSIFGSLVNACIFSKHKTESEYRCVLFAFVHVITWSCVSVDVHAIGDTFRISA